MHAVLRLRRTVIFVVVFLDAAMFTEVPRDVWALGGQDVEMACSFRGAGTPSYSLEIQWWYIRNRPDWTDSQPWSTNEVSPGEGLPKDATKISVVKVAGSNISHKLRLSSVRPRDEGTYECRVIDFSDAAGARHHRARAYLQVEVEEVEEVEEMEEEEEEVEEEVVEMEEEEMEEEEVEEVEEMVEEVEEEMVEEEEEMEEEEEEMEEEEEEMVEEVEEMVEEVEEEEEMEEEEEEMVEEESRSSRTRIVAPA
ncbi:unnamed protein product [Arctogadus glacialis]